MVLNKKENENKKLSSDVSDVMWMRKAVWGGPLKSAGWKARLCQAKQKISLRREVRGTVAGQRREIGCSQWHGKRRYRIKKGGGGGARGGVKGATTQMATLLLACVDGEVYGANQTVALKTRSHSGGEINRNR